jgi:hypothetical protein
MPVESFSSRLGYVQPRAIIYSDDLPAKLRFPIFEILQRYTSSAFLWDRIEKLLNPYGTDDWPVSTEAIPVSRGEDNEHAVAAKRVLSNCPWFRVYDVIEDVFKQLDFHDTEWRIDPEEEARAFPFQQDINNYLTHAGIGWQLVDGKVIARGDEAFEVAVKTAAAELRRDERPTAARQIHDALQALSRRPEPNFRGAIIHGMGALECIARDLTGDQKLTLGQVLKRHPNLLPRPVDEALSQLWGYASNEARHVEEGREPNREEAELMVGLAATVATYLTKKRRESA